MRVTPPSRLVTSHGSLAFLRRKVPADLAILHLPIPEDPQHPRNVLALLLDVLLTDGDTVRSLAIGCDPDPVWFDEFDPLGEPAA